MAGAGTPVAVSPHNSSKGVPSCKGAVTMHAMSNLSPSPVGKQGRNGVRTLHEMDAMYNHGTLSCSTLLLTIRARWHRLNQHSLVLCIGWRLHDS